MKVGKLFAAGSANQPGLLQDGGAVGITIQHYPYSTYNHRGLYYLKTYWPVLTAMGGPGKFR